jgi:hypothetical protein
VRLVSENQTQKSDFKLQSQNWGAEQEFATMTASLTVDDQVDTNTI